MKKKTNKFVKIVAFIAGWILVIAGGVSLAITTIPGVALIFWSLTGKDKIWK